jgi:hypothetical protein
MTRLLPSKQNALRCSEFPQGYLVGASRARMPSSTCASEPISTSRPGVVGRAAELGLQLRLVTDHRHVRRATDRGRIPTDRRTGLLQHSHLVGERLGRGPKRRIPAVGVPRSQGDDPPFSQPADPHRQPLLDRADAKAGLLQAEIAMAIQRFGPRRIGLTLMVLVGMFLAVTLVVNNLSGLGLLPG